MEDDEPDEEDAGAELGDVDVLLGCSVPVQPAVVAAARAATPPPMNVRRSMSVSP
ncbi:hypothetical protein ABZZ79_12640 [Streptomyces sp. NPDC006458]|uniref:hypothetical protein n=1 Tax=Streptomyces sp. NPDC006458 TaxID=3154302 RepID=UPI0033BCE1B1